MCLFVLGGIVYVFVNDISGCFEWYSVFIFLDKIVDGYLI